MAKPGPCLLVIAIFCEQENDTWIALKRWRQQLLQCTVSKRQQYHVREGLPNAAFSFQIFPDTQHALTSDTSDYFLLRKCAPSTANRVS